MPLRALEGTYAGPGCGDEALTGSTRTGNKEILTLPYEVQREETLHLVAVKPAADGVVNLLGIRFVAEGGIADKAFDGCSGAVVPLAGKEPVQEAVRSHRLCKSGREAFRKGDAIPCSFILCIRSRDTALRSFSGLMGAVLLFVSIVVFLFFVGGLVGVIVPSADVLVPGRRGRIQAGRPAIS